VAVDEGVLTSPIEEERPAGSRLCRCRIGSTTKRDVLVVVPGTGIGPANLTVATRAKAIEQAEVGEIAASSGDRDEIATAKCCLGVGAGRRGKASAGIKRGRRHADQMCRILVPHQRTSRHA